MRWFAPRIGGQKWRVDLVRPKHPAFGGDNVHGMTLHDKCQVYIATGYEEDTLSSTAVHEVFGHASFHVAGVSQIIIDLCGGDEAKAETVEEEMIRRLELVWYPMFRELGFRFPKVNQ